MKKGEKRFPENQTPLQALIAARRLIEQPENWAQRGWGEDGKHCMGAAISRCSSSIDVYLTAIWLLKEATGTTISKKNIYDWNDTHTHDEVLAAYERAIAIASVSAKVVTEESA